METVLQNMINNIIMCNGMCISNQAIFRAFLLNLRYQFIDCFHDFHTVSLFSQFPGFYMYLHVEIVLVALVWPGSVHV